VTVVIGMLVAFAAPAQQGGASGALGPVPWQELRFSARKLFLRADAVIRIEEVPLSRAATQLRQPPQGTPRTATGPRIAELTVQTDLPFGRGEHVTLWLDPHNGAVHQVDKRTSGSRPYRKVRRYLQSGYYSWRTSPANEREARGNHDVWTRARGEMVGGEVPSRALLTDSYALFHLVSAARLDREGSTSTAYFFSDEQLVVLELAAGDLEVRSVDFELVLPDGSASRRSEALTRRVTAAARPVTADASAADIDLGFLGMKGELAIYVEVGTGIPVELSGRTEHLGRVTVQLQRARLAPADGAS
jgi:hypothetical protein